MAAVALAVSGYGCSTADEPPAPVIRTVTVERETPAEAKRKCDDPVRLPDRHLNETETHDLWGKDRTALRVCESRRAAAVGTAK